ncbi:hypothetical protein FBU30_002176 [Linnemannia zychae]|nr:hypothetical protein FBU30_002176 [Linnemannia zychae]
MPSIFSAFHRTSVKLYLFCLIVSLCLFISFAHGQTDSELDQEDSPSPSPPLQSPEQLSPSSSPEKPELSLSPSITITPTLSPTAVAPILPPTQPNSPPPPALGTPAFSPTLGTTVSPPPNPIFSTSDACVACQKEFPVIRNCSALIPPLTVNLTTIVQVLPFYSCLCQNNPVEIDALQQCSYCFRSTGQQAFLHSHFYNVTNQQVKAIKQVCEDTDGGSRVPSSQGGTGLRDTILQSIRWGFYVSLVSVLLVFASS